MSKSTETFKKTIKDYLDNLAGTDPLFATTYQKEGKNIDDCITYILNTVQKSGCSGFTDDEVFGMAIHYYDEDAIEVGKPMNNANVVVNHQVQLSEEEIKEAKEKGIQQAIDEARKSMQKKSAVMTPKPKEETKCEQTSLF
jgi:hypothetical protein